MLQEKRKWEDRIIVGRCSIDYTYSRESIAIYDGEERAIEVRREDRRNLAIALVICEEFGKDD